MTRFIFIGIGLLFAVFSYAQEAIGNRCEYYETLEEVSLSGHGDSRLTNSLFLSRGQSFTVPDTVNEISGILIHIVELFEADTLMLTLYEGPAPIGEDPAEPIAMSQLVVSQAIPAGSEVPAYFEFPSSIEVTPGKIYYFLVSLNDNANLRIATHRKDVYDGGRYLDYTIGGILMTRSWDLPFEIYSCVAPDVSVGEADLDISDAENVPTLGEWGLIILSLSLIAFSLVGIREMSFQFNKR